MSASPRLAIPTDALRPLSPAAMPVRHQAITMDVAERLNEEEKNKYIKGETGGYRPYYQLH